MKRFFLPNFTKEKGQIGPSKDLSTSYSLSEERLRGKRWTHAQQSGVVLHFQQYLAVIVLKKSMH